MAALPNAFDSPVMYHIVVLQPRSRLNDHGLGFSPFARHYLGNHYCSLFLSLLRCFSSAGSPTLTGVLGVAPFGNPRINASVQLPEAYRSFTRPSSPPYAKASTVCPYYLSSQSKHHAPDPTQILSYPGRPKTTALPRALRSLLLLTSLRQRTSGVPTAPSRTGYPHPSFPTGVLTAPCRVPYALLRVELVGVEPTTSCLQGRRSSQLSYSPNRWAWKELNLRPHAYQACALTT
jgi:hypothetical protein